MQMSYGRVPEPVRLNQLAIALHCLRHLVELADTLFRGDLPGTGRAGEDVVIRIRNGPACPSEQAPINR
jgi:hypothetical protein